MPYKKNSPTATVQVKLNPDYIELTEYKSYQHFFYHQNAEKFKKEICDETINHKNVESIVREKIENSRTIFTFSSDNHSGLKFVRKGEPFFENYKVKVKISANHGLGKLRIGCELRNATAAECKENGLPDNAEIYSPRKIVNSHK